MKKKEMAKMNKKGIGVTSFIVGILLFSAMVQFGISYTTEINDKYSKNVNLSRIRGYDNMAQGLNLSNTLVDTIVKKEADTSLSFLSLPLFVWSALKTVMTGTLNAPVVVLDMITLVQQDLGLPDWVDDVLIAALSVTLMLAITSAVLGRNVD